ncbi:uncharacterized protein LOC124888852 [Capsicum annuum]|uniref:uncharacterized protein LOC124888852 n=1 Tax=Capsicum annuum TaxID=4072 RepID=UPI001FB13485|nr:uncharacterized protein LOC124888852 [Capsicum annuum]
MNKKLVVDSNEEAPKSQERDEKELMMSKEMVDEERDPKVVESDEQQGDPLPTMKFPPPFPQRLKKKEDNAKFKTFLSKLSNVSINIPLLKVIQEIPGYAKLMKKLISKKCLVDDETIKVTHGCSSIMTSAIAKKKEDTRAFTIPCTIGTHKFEKALCDLSAKINLMLHAIYQILSLGTPTPTTMRLLMADRHMKKPVGILFDV